MFVCLFVTRMDDNNHHWTTIINQWPTIKHQFMMSYSFYGQTKCSYKWKNKKILRIKGENLDIEPREKKTRINTAKYTYKNECSFHSFHFFYIYHWSFAIASFMLKLSMCASVCFSVREPTFGLAKCYNHSTSIVFFFYFF